MGDVKTLAPEGVQKVERVLGADIETATYEELSEKFEAVQKEFEAKTYGVSFTQDSIALLTMEILPKVEWVGQQAWDIAESQKLVSELKPDVVINVKKEAIRALFQFVATNKYVGVDHVYQVSQLLTTLAEIIQNQIGKDEQETLGLNCKLQKWVLHQKLLCKKQ